jgi:hypothetical protein
VIKTAILTVVLSGLGFADRIPSQFEGTYQVTRINVETGDKCSEELRISWFGGYFLLEDIQASQGEEPVEQEGIEYGGWLAALSADHGGVVGLYKKDGDGITGVEADIGNRVLATLTSEGAEPLDFRPQWVRGLYDVTGINDCDSVCYHKVMELTGTDKLWAMDERYPTAKIKGEYEWTGYGVSSGNGVAMMFLEGNLAILRLYTITGGNLEGRWLSRAYRDSSDRYIYNTGLEELSVLKIYE